MATSTTVQTVKSQLVTSLGAHADLSGINVAYAWEPWRDGDQVFLGQVDFEYEIPTIKSGRKLRQETYTVDVVFRAVDHDKTPQGAVDVETRALSYKAALDDILADDVQIAGVTAIQWAQMGSGTIQLDPHEKGWACQITVTVEVEARLQ